MSDRATAYASKVVAGEIVASAPVRGECRRHLDDLGDSRWVWDLEEAERVIRFIEDAASYNEEWVMFEWMCFFAGRLYGMRHAGGSKQGLRRFTSAFLITGRGSGKSALTGMLSLYHLLDDGVREPLVLVAARDRNQADTSFKDSVLAMEQSRCFRDGGKPIGKRLGGNFAFRLVRNDRMGEIQKVSGDSKSAVGRRQTAVILDEFAQHRDNSMYESLMTGFKLGPKGQPMTIITTNAGELLDSPCGMLYQAARKVALGESESESMMPFIAECDEMEDKPLEDESCWIKANPALPTLPGMDEIREDVKRAKDNPDYADAMLRLRFGFWRPSSEVWLPMKSWEDAKISKDEWDKLEPKIANWPCYLGLDLSETRDLTGGAAVWVGPEGQMVSRVFAWTPADTLPQRSASENLPYRAWVRDGQLIPLPGKVIKYEHIASWLSEMMDQWQVVGCAFDRRKMSEVRKKMDLMGIPWSKKPGGKGLWLIEHYQGFQWLGDEMTKADRKKGNYRLYMSRSIDQTEEAILHGDLRCLDSRPLIMAAHGIRMVRDDAMNRKASKRDSLTQTDVLIALIQAVGLAKSQDNVSHGPTEAEFDLLTAFLEGAPTA